MKIGFDAWCIRCEWAIFVTPNITRWSHSILHCFFSKLVHKQPRVCLICQPNYIADSLISCVQIETWRKSWCIRRGKTVLFL